MGMTKVSAYVQIMQFREGEGSSVSSHNRGGWMEGRRGGGGVVSSGSEIAASTKERTNQMAGGQGSQVN